jgi:hypothetical protein
MTEWVLLMGCRYQQFGEVDEVGGVMGVVGGWDIKEGTVIPASQLCVNRRARGFLL